MQQLAGHRRVGRYNISSWTIFTVVFFVLMLMGNLAFAADSNTDNSTYGTFIPSADDISVYLLSIIFGVVDGVLHGSGSQIMGQMFAVFNASVLFLAGIIFSYIIGKGVVDTAHEGEFMGKNKSTFMVPIRIAVATALLLPKATGYCVLQIVVMWLVVQGVGVADHVWSAALDYVNRGGSLASAPASTTNSAIISPTMTISGQILTSQVCMVMLEQSIGAVGGQYNVTNSSTNAPMYFGSGVPPLPPPSFLSTINLANYATQINQSPYSPLSVPMPNFPVSSPYSKLNGACGVLSPGDYNQLRSNGNPSFSGSGSLTDQMNLARLVAVQQLYMELQPTANLIVNNIMSNQNLLNPAQAPGIGTASNSSGGPSTPINPSSGLTYGPGALTWNGGLTSGFELYSAAVDYLAIIQPNLNLLSSANNSSAQQQMQSIINSAEDKGWLLAGTFYFQLTSLAQAAGSGTTDLATTSVSYNGGTTLTMSSIDAAVANFAAQYNVPSTYFLGKLNVSSQSSSGTSGSIPVDLHAILSTLLSPSSQIPAYDLGDYINSAIVYGSTQAGQNSASGGGTPDYSQLLSTLNYTPDSTISQGAIWKSTGASCPSVRSLSSLIKASGCYGLSPFISLYYSTQAILTSVVLPAAANLFIKTIFNLNLSWVNALSTNLQNASLDPLVTLGQLGVSFINNAFNAWMIFTMIGSMLSLSNSGFIALLMLLAPVVTAIVGAYMAAGITFTYYITLLPYMLFTFGGLSWLIAVIEAMVAAPLVAFGILHPDGHETWGRSEPALMILLNVFFRPALMIIGFIAGASLARVGLMLLNMGFGAISTTLISTIQATGFAGAIAPIFLLIIYLSMVTQIVTKAFALIHILPDKVLRFLQGGQAESLGAETAGMVDQTKNAVEGASGRLTGTGGQISQDSKGAVREQRQQSQQKASEKANKEKDDERERRADERAGKDTKPKGKGSIGTS